MQIGVDTEKALDNRRVFVVHDDEIISAALQFMLHDEVETHEIGSLEAAYVKGAEWKPSVLLLGIGIVKDKGIAVISEICAQLDGVKIIIVADTADDPLARECLKKGAKSILAKPLTIENTRRRVDTMLGRRVALGIPVVTM
jgi:DNA-binding NtrC family response regulator